MSEALKSPSLAELYRQLRALPADQNGEILDGELVTSPRPRFPHASVSTEISGDLRIRYRRKPGDHDPNGWWIVAEPELHLGPHVVSPDIAGWKRVRMPTPPDAAFVTLSPDWICEILSPSTERYDRRAKARIYHEAGVTHHWLVSPTARTVEVYRREGDFWTRLGVWSDEAAARLPPFEEVELDLWAWWDGMPEES